MIKLNYEEYLDKVFGCWLGKCVSGNIGAPFEGMKQKLDLKFSNSMLEEMLPNDDLDLQVLFLEVVEKYGLDFTSEDLAKSFYTNCPYAPGEYAYFKKNYQSGIHPPMSGKFNNSVYHNGMGCTIRSEIWACLAPNNPVLAVELCRRDACLDHYGDGIEGEVFMTALESLAFGESDINKLITMSKKYVDKNTRFYSLVEDVENWCEQYKNIDIVRNKIVSYYGSAEATLVYQNVGFIIAGLKLLGDDLIDMTIKVCECGFDTDCTCATAGAVKGIILGAKAINSIHNFNDMTYKLGVTTNKRTDKVKDLAVEVATLGAQLCGIECASHYNFQNREDIEFAVKYVDDEPSICFDESKKVILNVKNNTSEIKQIKLTLNAPYPLIVENLPDELELKSQEAKDISLNVKIADGATEIGMRNVITISYGQNKHFEFGFIGAYRFKVYGPFWKNNVEVPKLKEKESYWNYFPAATANEQMDKIRFYHTNSLSDFGSDTFSKITAANYLCTINNAEDLFNIEKYCHFDGQASYILVYDFNSIKEMKCGIQIGFNDSIKFYLNDRLLLNSVGSERYTPENRHFFDEIIKSGDNRIVVELNTCGSSKFSFNFLEGSACSNHITDFKIIK